MKEAYYFSHDYNARNDPDILAMRSKYGSEGYGWYWMIVEILREQSDFALKKDKYLCITLAMQLQCDCIKLASYIEDCINEYELFQTDGDFLWSDSLIRRMDERNTKSEKAKNAANARWHKGSKKNNDVEQCKGDASAMQPHEGSNAIKEKKGKEKKGNEIKEKKESKENINSLSLKIAKDIESLTNMKWILSTKLEELNVLIEMYTYEWVKEAINIAASKKKYNLQYAEGILKTWTREGKEEAHGQAKRDKPSEADPDREGIGIEI